MAHADLPTWPDVADAAARLAGVAHRTPVITSRSVNARTGCEVFFKCENLQRSGSFKFRGAYNALSRLNREQQRCGVVAYSSGNHAQAVALAGQLLDVPRVIVMPSDAPSVKRAATLGYGAEIVTYDRVHESREAIGARLANERGLALVPPFDHQHVIAGQGTAALELIEEVGGLDVLLVPCGGGGLLSGSALAAREHSPGCRVVGVEPSAGDDAARSFRTGTLQLVENPATVADGARTSSLGRLTLPLVLGLASDVLTVSDNQLLKAMFYLWERLNVIVEPTGALGAAALLEGDRHWQGRRVGIVLSGGNVDFSQVTEWLALC
jgi:threonine dehydratase